MWNHGFMTLLLANMGLALTETEIKTKAQVYRKSFKRKVKGKLEKDSSLGSWRRYIAEGFRLSCEGGRLSLGSTSGLV